MVEGGAVTIVEEGVEVVGIVAAVAEVVIREVVAAEVVMAAAAVVVKSRLLPCSWVNIFVHIAKMRES